MTDRIEIVDYKSPDREGVVPDLNNYLSVSWRNNKTSKLYIVRGVGFNTSSQLWEYQYYQATFDLIFHRPIKEFHEKFTRYDDYVNKAVDQL